MKERLRLIVGFWPDQFRTELSYTGMWKIDIVPLLQWIFKAVITLLY